MNGVFNHVCSVYKWGLKQANSLFDSTLNKMVELSRAFPIYSGFSNSTLDPKYWERNLRSKIQSDLKNQSEDHLIWYRSFVMKCASGLIPLDPKRAVAIICEEAKVLVRIVPLIESEERNVIASKAKKSNSNSVWHIVLLALVVLPQIARATAPSFNGTEFWGAAKKWSATDGYVHKEVIAQKWGSTEIDYRAPKSLMLNTTSLLENLSWNKLEVTFKSPVPGLLDQNTFSETFIDFSGNFTFNIIEVKKKIEEIKRKKSGRIWQCTEVVRKKDGLFYGFQKGVEFLNSSQLSKKYDEIFPAVEPLDITNFIGEKNRSKAFDKLMMFGYYYTDGARNDEQPTLWLPDIETLRRRLRMHKYDILIASSEGIAGDEEFSRMHLTSHVLLSNGKEFVHDHIFHVFSAIRKYLKKKPWEFSYQEVRKWMLSDIISAVDVIEGMKKKIDKLWWKDSVLSQKHIDLYWGVLSSWIDLHTNTWVDLHDLYPFSRYDRLSPRSLSFMVGNFKEFYDRFGSETKEKYGTLTSEDFAKLEGFYSAYSNCLSSNKL